MSRADRPGPIVDAQVHVWAASTPERPWPARHAAHREVPLSDDDLLEEMDRAGVDAAILVPPSWEGERNDLVSAASRAHPDRFAFMGRLDPDDAAVADRIARWREQPGALGLRFSLHRPGMAEALDDGRLEPIWHAAEHAGVPIMLLVPQAQMSRVDAVARRHPGLRIVLDHLGAPSSIPLDQRFVHLDRLLALAVHANVAVKASALPCLCPGPWPFRDVHAPLRRVVDAFGPRRVFWGSDLTRLPCSYVQSLTMFDEMPWLSDADLGWILGRGLCEWLGWMPVRRAETDAALAR